MFTAFFILFSSEGRKCDFFVRHNASLTRRHFLATPVGRIMDLIVANKKVALSGLGPACDGKHAIGSTRARWPHAYQKKCEGLGTQATPLGCPVPRGVLPAAWCQKKCRWNHQKGGDVRVWLHQRILNAWIECTGLAFGRFEVWRQWSRQVERAVHRNYRRSWWRTKKSHFQPLVKMGMKTVDKNIDKKNKQWVF